MYAKQPPSSWTEEAELRGGSEAKWVLMLVMEGSHFFLREMVFLEWFEDRLDV